MHAFGRCWLELMVGDVDEAVVGLHGVRLADERRQWNGAKKNAMVVIFCCCVHVLLAWVNAECRRAVPGNYYNASTIFGWEHDYIGETWVHCVLKNSGHRYC